MYIKYTLVIVRVVFFLAPPLQGEGSAPVQARLAPTQVRVNQSPVYCLRLHLTKGEQPGLRSSCIGAPVDAYLPGAGLMARVSL